MDSTCDLPSVYSSSDRGEKKKKKKFSSNNVSRLHFVSLSFHYMGVYRVMIAAVRDISFVMCAYPKGPDGGNILKPLDLSSQYSIVVPYTERPSLITSPTLLVAVRYLGVSDLERRVAMVRESTVGRDKYTTCVALMTRRKNLAQRDQQRSRPGRAGERLKGNVGVRARKAKTSPANRKQKKMKKRERERETTSGRLAATFDLSSPGWKIKKKRMRQESK